MQASTNTPRTTATPLTETSHFLAFQLGTQEFGIDLQKVLEICAYENVSHIINAPDFIKGMANRCGRIVPIIDLRIKFNTGTPIYDSFTVVTILNIADHFLGMVADKVMGVISLAAEQIKPAPDMGMTLDNTYITGLGSHKEHKLILLDIDKLMSSREMQMQETSA